jgi:hypothetical protein
MNDKEITLLLKQIMSADKTPEYGYDSSDPESHQNRAGHEPPVGERWMTPRELCKDCLRGRIPVV